MPDNLTRVTLLVPLSPKAVRDGIADIGGALRGGGDKPGDHSVIVWEALSGAELEPASPDEVTAFVATLPELTAPQERALRAVVASPVSYEPLMLGGLQKASWAKVTATLARLGLVARAAFGFDATAVGRAWVAARTGEPAPSGGAPSSPTSAAAQGRGIRRSLTGGENR